MSASRIFSCLPNLRRWKATITAQMNLLENTA